MKKNLLGASLITVTGLYVLLAAIIILVTFIVGYPPIYGIGISIIVLILQFLISPFFTDLSMKWFYRVKFGHEIPDYLKQFINEVCKEHNMKYPRIGYIDDGAPNAFTYGHTKNDARIVLTRGIFELLTEEEVKAVVGHELGHALHYDMLFMTVAQLVPLILYGIYEMLVSDNNNDSDNSAASSIGMLAYILYVISNYIILWLSRTREYYADSSSIEFTKNPNALANALVKIGLGLTTAETNPKHSAARSNALGIFDSKASKSMIVTASGNGEVSKDNIKQAMKWEMWNVWAKWYEFNSTHPLISKRLLAISERSKEFNQEPYIVFDLQKPESSVDDFIVEVLLDFAPVIGLIIGVIAWCACMALNQKIFLASGIAILIADFFFYLNFRKRYCKQPFTPTKVRDLLSEVKVSNITSIPCSLEGTIIGRGNPGCIFNEDFVIKDDTGIIFLDYNQPVNFVNKIFALFKSQEYFDKKVKVNGWYRRCPVPYVELKTIEIDGKVKKVYTYKFSVFIYIFLAILGVVLLCLQFI